MKEWRNSIVKTEVEEVEQNTEKTVKVYVRVSADFDADGTLLPQVITWETGEKFTIDKVTEIRQAAARKAGGQGDRYTIWVNGQQSYLFFERSAAITGCELGKWFVEKKTA